jgi:5-methyltetrahydropteroyltriglutamate--homocysteine methyltransferase
MANEYTYRADHVGSLIRPPALVEARARHARGEIGIDGLQEAENAAIKSVVEMQRAVGIAVATDGGFRSTAPAAEAAFLRTLTRRPIKLAVPAARPSDTNEPLARADVVRKEIAALIAAGVDYIQLDAPGYAGVFDAPKEKIDKLLKLDTSALSGIERQSKVRIGAYLDPRAGGAFGHAINGHEALAERLFNELPVDRFLLPFDGTGAIDFAFLRLVPKGKLVVLGLVSTTTSALEDVDKLLAQIDAAAKVIDGDNLAISPASGFATGTISEADQRRKLALVVDVATRWWGFEM